MTRFPLPSAVTPQMLRREAQIVAGLLRRGVPVPSLRAASTLSNSTATASSSSATSSSKTPGASHRNAISSSSSLLFRSSTTLSRFFLQQQQQPVRGFAGPATVTGNVGDTIPFNLADIGEGIAECEVLKWFVKVGDTVHQFDKICEVQSDKANVEITSRFDGVVTELCYQVGQMAYVGKPLIHIKLTKAAGGGGGAGGGNADTAAAAAKPAAAAAAGAAGNGKPAAAAAAAGPPQIVNNDIKASPSVRRIAREKNIDLAHVAGTGMLGQITKQDIADFEAKHGGGAGGAPAAVGAAAAASASPTAAAAPKLAPLATSVPIRGGGGVVAAPAAAAAPGVAAAAAAAGGAKPAKAAAAAPAPVVPLQSDVEVPVTGIQRIMVKTMNAAALIPTFGYGDEIVMDNLIKLRKKVAPVAEARYGVKLSYFAFIIKATSLALTQYPMMNAHVNADCSAVTHRAAHNIGLAMDTPRGLLVPNIKNVQALSVLDIGRELARLQKLGAEGKLGQSDLGGGTFTLSNVGTIGGTYCRPVLVIPEVCIGALGRFASVPRFNEKGDQVVPSTVMHIGWTADHRVLDGATVARFSNAWKQFIEVPETMILF